MTSSTEVQALIEEAETKTELWELVGMVGSRGDEALSLIERLTAALSSLSGETETEWEWGVEHVQADGWVDRELHLTLSAAKEDFQTCGMNCTLMRRRKAGPWIEVV